MDFNIVTFHREYNYGAVLQAYALQEFIKKIGFSAGIYDYIPKPFYSKVSMKKKLLDFVGDFSKKAIAEREKKYNDFIENEMNLSTEANSRVYVAGSDQVWNPTGAFDSGYFLQFVQSPSKKISYAASMGEAKIPDDKKDRFEAYIKDFDAISVREENAKECINDMYDNDISVNVDPTLLHKSDFYANFEKKVEGLPEKYILVYLMHFPKNVNKLIKWLKKETGYKVVLLDSQGAIKGLFDNLVVHNKAIHNAGPKEFLYLFHHTECVVTSSFHGTAFSLIFNKEFYAITSSPKSRISNILAICGLSGTSENEEHFVRNTSVDWSYVNSSLENERNKSETFFRSVFK